MMNVIRFFEGNPDHNGHIIANDTQGTKLLIECRQEFVADMEDKERLTGFAATDNNGVQFVLSAMKAMNHTT